MPDCRLNDLVFIKTGVARREVANRMEQRRFHHNLDCPHPTADSTHTNKYYTRQLLAWHQMHQILATVHDQVNCLGKHFESMAANIVAANKCLACACLDLQHTPTASSAAQSSKGELLPSPHATITHTMQHASAGGQGVQHTRHSMHHTQDMHHTGEGMQHIVNNQSADDRSKVQQHRQCIIHEIMKLKVDRHTDIFMSRTHIIESICLSTDA